MRNKLFLLSLVFLFLISFASAQSASIDLFYAETDGNSLEIMEGDSFGIIISAHTILENSMTVQVDLMDTNNNVIQSLLNVQTPQSIYFNDLVIGESIYNNPGNYFIRGFVFGSPTLSSETVFLSLSVLSPTAGNNPPEITSTAPSSINGGDTYTYQVIASDADNDALTYSLTQSPSWLSITPGGFISGIAPNNAPVNPYQYIATVRVSDGIDFDTQTFTIDVTSVEDPADPDPTTPLVVNPIADQTIEEEQSYNFGVGVSGGEVPYSFSLSNSFGWLSISNAGVITGTAPNVNADTPYVVVVRVTDADGQIDTEQYTLTVEDVPDPVDPVDPEPSDLVITSFPTLQINENDFYNYLVLVEGGNPGYSFSLTTGATWLSISSGGLVSGTAPSVDSDTSFNVIIEVTDQDGEIETQTYILTVINSIPEVEEIHLPRRSSGVQSIDSPVFDQSYGLSLGISGSASVEEGELSIGDDSLSFIERAFIWILLLVLIASAAVMIIYFSRKV